MCKTVLVIDDEEKMRELYLRMFDAAGRDLFEVHTAESAEQATEILIRQDIDLVILDINMPEVGGCTMFDVIREYSPDMKVLISSVYPVTQQKRFIPHAGEYYDKSEGLFRLLQLVTCMLK